MSIQWTVPGTTKPNECDIFELMRREELGQPVTSSEVIISYHFLDEALANELADRVLTSDEAVLFHQLRAINPGEFQPVRRWWQSLSKPRIVTWRDYAERLDYDDDSFWRIWDGVGGRIESYLKTRLVTA